MQTFMLEGIFSLITDGIKEETFPIGSLLMHDCTCSSAASHAAHSGSQDPALPCPADMIQSSIRFAYSLILWDTQKLMAGVALRI